MAPAFRAMNNTIWTDPAGGTTLNKPTGTIDGDIVLLFFVTNGATATPPTGFTAFSGYPLASVGGVVTFAWWKVASSEPASYTITTPGSTTQAIVVSYSGADTTTPWSPSPTANTGTGVTSTYLGLTTPVNSCLVIIIGWDFGDTQNALSAPAGSTPTFTTRYTAGGGSDLIYLGDGTLATAGATGNKTQTNNSISTNPWRAMMYSLQPLVVSTPAGPPGFFGNKGRLGPRQT